MLTSLIAIMLLAGCASQGQTQEGADQGDTKEPMAVVEVGNKICPVSGEKVPEPGEKGEMGEVVKYEYNGKIYNLCCPMCIKDFKKDPEKYSKIAEEEVKKDAESQAGEAQGSEK